MISFLRRLVLLLCVLPFSLTAVSQERLKFEIVDFDVDPFDLSAKNPQYEKYDGNGERYAIIKVTSENPNDNLDAYVFNFGNLKHIVENHDGTLWVYVQRNAKQVSVSRDGYVPVSKYDLHTTIESGKNYVMTLSSQSRRIMTQMVQFNVKPANINAVIMIKGSAPDSREELFGYTDAKGGAAKNLEYGTYTYKVLADNYVTSEGRFTLNDKDKTLVEDVTLKSNFSEITLKVDADAEIYVNGDLKGTREWTGALKAGNYQIECRQANHQPSVQFVTVVDNENKTVELKAPAPITGTVAITSSPLDADIKIDGKEYGKTPRNIDIIIGKHLLSLSLPDYSTQTREFTVEENKVTDIDIPLNPIADNSKGMGIPVDNAVKPGKKPLLKSTDIYAGVGVGFGSFTNISVAVGADISNFNIEAYYNYALDSSPTVYWNSTSSPSSTAETGKYKPNLVLGAKAGYGFKVADRFRITPQAGYRYSNIQGPRVKGYCSSVSLGVRGYVAITPNIGVSLMPEYYIGVAKSEAFKELAKVTSKINKFGEGFNLNLSFVVSF